MRIISVRISFQWGEALYSILGNKAGIFLFKLIVILLVLVCCLLFFKKSNCNISSFSFGNVGAGLRKMWGKSDSKVNASGAEFSVTPSDRSDYYRDYK